MPAYLLRNQPSRAPFLSAIEDAPKWRVFINRGVIRLALAPKRDGLLVHGTMGAARLAEPRLPCAGLRRSNVLMEAYVRTGAVPIY